MSIWSVNVNNASLLECYQMYVAVVRTEVGEGFFVCRYRDWSGLATRRARGLYRVAHALCIAEELYRMNPWRLLHCAAPGASGAKAESKSIYESRNLIEVFGNSK